jgi:2'-5' RNA ligase
MRLFVAIDLPDTIKIQLNKICYGLPGVRWSKLDQMHLTLRFIGDVDDHQAEAIHATLQSVEFKGFEMLLQGVGQFPPQGTPRVLWIGVEAPPILTKLAKQVDAAITGLGLAPADKSFEAHITLARLKTPLHHETTRQFFARNAHFETPSFKIDQFGLYSSLLAPQGATYRCEAVYMARS